MTNQEHWQKAKEQVAKEVGYGLGWTANFEAEYLSSRTNYAIKLLTEAAELMAQSIRDEYEIKQAGLEHTISIYESSQDDWKGIVAKKNKEIERLKGDIKIAQGIVKECKPSVEHCYEQGLRNGAHQEFLSEDRDLMRRMEDFINPKNQTE